MSELNIETLQQNLCVVEADVHRESSAEDYFQIDHAQTHQEHIEIETEGLTVEEEEHIEPGNSPEIIDLDDAEADVVIRVGYSKAVRLVGVPPLPLLTLK
jgi:hypothetical protein